jgi:hypothetical protein
VDNTYSNLSSSTKTASGIFLDGTMKTIKVKAVSTDSNATKESLDPDDENYATINKWYTYTESTDGVYTVKLVSESIPNGTTVKYAQYPDANAAFWGAKTDGENEDVTIDTKHVFLKGADAGDYAKVYGNDNTVYLTVGVKDIRVANTGDDEDDSAVIINEVKSVTTGIKNANITVWYADQYDGAGDHTDSALYKADQVDGIAGESDQNSAGVYTLYKSNGYVVAAVVVGEDSASSKNLVYVSSKTGDDGVAQEAYDKTNDEWTWTRKVIQGGQEVELKEVGDSLQYLNDMTQYEWYQVKLNANDEVIGVESVATALTTGKTRFVNNITDLDTIENTSGVETVLYSQSFLNSKPSMKNNTLYVTSTIAANNGFYVSDTANIALIETVKNKQETTYETGAKALQSIIETLNQNNAGGFNYDISAVIEDGIATSVVIYDRTKNGTTTSGSSSSSDIMVVLPEGTGHVTVYTTNDSLALDDAIDAVTTEIENAGYTVTSGPNDGGENTITWIVRKGSLTRTFTYAHGTGEGEDLNVDQTFVTVDDDTVPLGATKTVAAAVGGITGYVRVVDKKNDIDKIVAADDASEALTSSSVLTTGYYKVVLSGGSIDGTNISKDNLVESGSGLYALGTATVKAGTGATGTGVAYNTDKYGAYGVVTYATIAANDGDGNDGQATIGDVGYVKLTTISSSETDGAEKAVAYNTADVLSAFTNSERYALNGAVYTKTAQAPDSVKLTGDTVYEEVYTITVASGSEPTSEPAVINGEETSKTVGKYTFGYTKNSYVSILGTNSWYVKASDATNAIITVTVNCSNKADITGTDTVTVSASDSGATVGSAVSFASNSTSVQRTITVSNPTKDTEISVTGSNNKA